MHLTRSARALRAVGAASISTFVALFSHVAAGGTVPGFAGIAVPLALAVLFCLPLAGRRLSVVRLGLSVVVSQTLFHTLFVLGASGPASSAPSGGHAAHGAQFIPTAGVAPAVSSFYEPVMWIGHLVAAIVTITALHHGERVIERIAALRDRIWAAMYPAVVVLEPVSAARRVRVVMSALPFVARRRREDDVAPLRGPPLVVA